MEEAAMLGCIITLHSKVHQSPTQTYIQRKTVILLVCISVKFCYIL